MESEAILLSDKLSEQMKRWFLAHFKNERDYNGFLSWLRAWEYDNKYDTEAKIRFVRIGGRYSTMTVHCSDDNFSTLFHAVGGYNGTAEE